MSNGSSRNSSHPGNPAQNWDHPNSLGWQVWRRAHSTGLSTQSVQRDLARFRINILQDHAPLLAHIRRRWSLEGNSVVDRFGLNLPLIWARPRLFHGSSESHQLPSFTPLALRRAAEPPILPSGFELPPVSGVAELPQAMRTKGDEQISEKAVVQKNARLSDSTDVNSDARLLELTISSLKHQRSGPDSLLNLHGSIPGNLLRKSYSPPFKSLSFPKASIGNPSETLADPTIKASAGENFPINSPKYFLVPRQLTLARQSLLPQRLVGQGLRYFSFSSGTPLLSAVARQQDWRISSSLHGSAAGFPGTDHLPISALSRPESALTPFISLSRGDVSSTEMTAPPKVSQARALHGGETGGQLRTSGQDSTISMAEPRDYEANIIPRSYSLQPTNLVVAFKERTISRTALSKPSVAGSTPERTALTRNRDITISRVEGKLTPQWSRVAGETTLVGRVMASVISRGSGTRSPVGVMLPPLAVTRHRFEQPFSLYNSNLAPTFGPRGFVSTPHRSTYVPAAGLEFAPHAEEVDARIVTSPSWAPSTDLRLTNPTASQITPTISRPFAAGAQERPGLPALSDERRISNLAGAHAISVFTTPRTAISMSPAAMPLSTPAVLRRAESMAGGTEQRFFSQRAVPVALTVSRVEYPGFPSSSEAARGNALGVGLSDTFAGERKTLQTNEGSDSNLVFGSVASRAVIESGRISNDATGTSVTTSPSQSFDGERHPKETHYPQSMGVSIAREAVAATGFGTVSVHGDIGRPRLPLPTHRGGLPLGGGIARTQRSLQRVTGRSAAPLLIARSRGIRTAMGDQLPGITIPTQAIQLMEPLSVEWIRDVRAGESSEFHLQSAGPTSVLAPMRPITITPPPLMRRSDVPARQEQHTPVPATRGISHDLPLAALSVMRDERSLAVLHRSNGTSLQTASQEAASAVSRPLPIGAGAEIPTVEAPAAAAKPQIDLDEIVEKAWQKLMRKLTVERERRGYTRWVSRS
jgi:hypothetical protein